MIKWDHEVYYGRPSALDLGKMREDAERLRRGDSYKKAESTIIHHHLLTEDCNDRKHEEYIPDAT